MRPDDWKFLASVLATAVLIAGVVYTSHLTDLQKSSGPKVDIKKIEALHSQGVITLEKADHWEEYQEKLQ